VTWRAKWNLGSTRYLLILRIPPTWQRSVKIVSMGAPLRLLYNAVSVSLYLRTDCGPEADESNETRCIVRRYCNVDEDVYVSEKQFKQELIVGTRCSMLKHWPKAEAVQRIQLDLGLHAQIEIYRESGNLSPHISPNPLRISILSSFSSFLRPHFPRLSAIPVKWLSRCYAFVTFVTE